MRKFTTRAWLRWQQRMVVLAGAVVCAGLVSASAVASPITYVFQGTASGTLDSVPFTDTVFTFSFYGDTDDLGHNAIAYIADDEIAPATIALAGQPTATVASDTYVLGGWPSGVAGFGVAGGDVLLIGVSGSPLPELANYHMDTPIGPVVGPVHPVGSVGGTFQTDLGVLELTSFSGGTATFQAIPEPSVATMLAGGLGVALAWRAQQRR